MKGGRSEDRAPAASPRPTVGRAEPREADEEIGEVAVPSQHSELEAMRSRSQRRRTIMTKAATMTTCFFSTAELHDTARHDEFFELSFSMVPFLLKKLVGLFS